MMDIKEEHKALLRGMGLEDEDFALFDGKWVKYEIDPEKGARIYDPYYRTHYNEYIGIDGWSAWSSENDTFMTDILKPAWEEAERRMAASPRPGDKEIADALRAKFGAKTEADEQ
ncbi:hypothetical protein [Desulfatiglans anilini]|uniref:hypothetical protein n=1 Tax=Desulfatiglans anilini TaxID=90728 RepID=UPI0012947F51|nr:hypothetical protein [Desulfatiglans anilini]